MKSWLRDPNSIAADGRPIKEEIESHLQWYIDSCLGYGPRSLRHWWCDGVIHLDMSKSSMKSIKLLGVAWITASRIAPFEIEVEFDPARDRFFTRTLFRIGSLDESGRPTLFEYVRHTDRVIASRPQRKSDWAMAIELTPPNGEGEDLAQ